MAEEKKEKLVKRSDKVAFMRVNVNGQDVYRRMKKFTEISTSRNAQEYSRQYVDEEGEDTDIVGQSLEKGFAFDEYTNNPVHEKIVEIIEDELTGDDAVVDILVVDKSRPIESGRICSKKKRLYCCSR